jgi:hypothetical protein
MKQQSAPERALKTIILFQKKMAGTLTVTGEQFNGILSETVPAFADDDDFAVISRSRPDGFELLFASTKKEKPVCTTESLGCLIPLLQAGKFEMAVRNEGDCIPKEFKSWMLIPIIAKKEIFTALLLARRHGHYREDELESAKHLGTFFSAALKDIRGRNKKSASIADETRHRILLRTQTKLARKQPEFPGFFQTIDYSACIGSDMGQTYRNGEDNFISCVCDLTADDTERQTALVYLDTWFAILSQTSLDVQSMITRLNADMVKRIAECYASVAVMKYSKSMSRAEISGTGNATVLYFCHDSMTVKVFTFGPAAGIKKDITILSQVLAVQSGDILCLCTDGLTEARTANGDLFGSEALAELVRRHYFLSAPDLANRILKALSETGKSGVNTDDRTLQILKIE